MVTYISLRRQINGKKMPANYETHTSVSVNKKTRTRLKAWFKGFGDTYDAVINRALDQMEKRR